MTIAIDNVKLTNSVPFQRFSTLPPAYPIALPRITEPTMDQTKEMDVFTNEKARLENTIPDMTLKEIKEVASFKSDSHSISTLSL